MVTRLQVVYRSPEIDEDLDKKILKFFNSLDFVCIDNKYLPLILRRELWFEKQSKEIEDESTRDKEAQLTT